MTLLAFLLRHDATTSNGCYQVCGSKKNDASGAVSLQNKSKQKLFEFEQRP